MSFWEQFRLLFACAWAELLTVVLWPGPSMWALAWCCGAAVLFDQGMEWVAKS